MSLNDDEWRSCLQCQGAGTIPHRRQRSIALRCPSCLGAGIVSGTAAAADEDVNDVAVVGGGPAGLALALALQQRGMSSAVYERDAHFLARRPGYGLTIQQGGTALKALGIADAVTAVGSKSRRHLSYDSTGSLIGAHGQATRDGAAAVVPSSRRRSNVHLPRQTLRELLLSRLRPNTVRWGRALTAVRESTSSSASRASTRRQGARGRRRRRHSVGRRAAASDEAARRRWSRWRSW